MAYETRNCLRCGKAARTWVRARGKHYPPYCSNACRRLQYLKPEKILSKKKAKKLIEDVKFFNSREWLSIRYEAFAKCGSSCLVCGRNRKHGITLHIDHIKPRSKYPELALDPNNLQVLCKDCNIGKSNKDEIDWRE